MRWIRSKLTAARRRIAAFPGAAERFVRNATPAIMSLIGIGLIVVSVILAFQDREASSAAMVVVGAGLLFFGSFANRLQGDVSLGPDGMKARLTESAIARVEELAEEHQITEKDKPKIESIVKRDAELLANATQFAQPSNPLWHPIIFTAAPPPGTIDYMVNRALAEAGNEPIAVDLKFRSTMKRGDGGPGAAIPPK